MGAEAAIDFRAVFASTPTPLIVLSPDFSILAANDLYAGLLRAARDTLVGRGLFDVLRSSAEAVSVLRASLQRVVASGKADEPPVFRYLAPGLPDVGQRYLSCSNIPIPDGSGQIVAIVHNAQDVTDVYGGEHARGSVLRRVERVQALNVSLLAESAQLRSLIERAPSFMCLLRGRDFRVELANAAFLDLVGPRELDGLPLREAVPELEGQLYLDVLERVVRTGEPFVGKQMRAEFARTPGSPPEEVFISFVFQPVVGEDGDVIAVFVDGNDVTDHVRAEKSQALLVRELHHRVRNTLATVQGVMNSTARTAETIEEYQWAFSGRISSLARTHSLLTEEIQQFVSFPHLLRQEIGVYAEGASDRVILEGPDVELPSQLAVPLGMTIHELTTNAFRHGALSAPEGRVTVTWSVQPAKEKRILICRWIEAGGPAVTPPARHGFGSMILTRVLTQQIGAKVDASYLPEGFELRADIPLVIERV